MLRSVYPIFCLVLVVAEPNSTTSKHGFIRTKRQGPDERSCLLPQPMVNGRYSPNIKRCPPHVSNAACKIVPGTPVPSGWDLYYGCDDGFVLNSTDTVSFCTDGNWSPSLPECIAGLPCLPLKSQYLNIKCSFQDKVVSCDQSMKPGTIASPECKSNYKPAYQVPYSYITCLNAGYWDYPLFYCTPEKLCPPLKAPNNIKVQYIYQDKVVRDDQLKPGTIAIPRCKHNYRPAYDPGYTNLTCLNSGSWDQQLFYCTAVCGASNEVGQLTPLIVDGVQANVGAFPWHAGLYYRDVDEGREIWDQRCGGSLINDQFVLTAAHCVASIQNMADLRVALGKYFRSWDIHEHTEEKRNVSMILFPREFSKKIFIFDIALLMLDVKIKPGEFIMPVCHGFLDGSNYIKDKNLFVVGWGKKENKMSSETLLYNDVTPVPSYECNQRAPSVFPMFDKFCAIKNSSEFSINQPGDSGGGVTAVYEGLHYLFGLVSLKFEKTTYFSNITWPFNMIWMEGEVKKHHPSFTWVEHEFLDNPDQPRPKSCMLPTDSDNRKFCSLAEHCDNCDARCIIPAGSQATRVRVVCNPGYSLRGAVGDVYSGGDVATCLSRGSWYPRIPECIKLTGKKYIAGDPRSYNKQGKWDHNNITYKVVKYPSNFPRDETDKAFRDAFNVWARHTPLTFTRVRRGPADIEIRFQGQGRYGANGEIAFEGPGGLLSATHPPAMGGDMYFDDDEHWTSNSPTGVNLFTSAAHEIGVALGLDHSSVKGAVMYPVLQDYRPDLDLHRDDIRSIQRLYPRKEEKR
ncbi:uncharacterized protein LOC128998583 isoform X2 [Macrosteles quadrilineatus]|uniref:uncharacterized protein LOC128998583 isoform X2 n=1 Tax=Macrosteles quadrilineatus TaxID=74068 RepID=UPI0023E27E5E|nr:uncharacterized protein LOC128998583 isoform X2 [Macrosteles quadrilineatus]